MTTHQCPRCGNETTGAFAAALCQAGEALDKAMLALTTKDSIHILRDPQLVNELHQALNVVVSIVGKPWREEQKEIDRHEDAKHDVEMERHLERFEE